MPINLKEFQKPQLIAGPPCPACGLTMVERTAKKGPRTGSKFWGCVQFASGNCKGTLPWEVGLQVLADLRSKAQTVVETKALASLSQDDMGFLAFLDAQEVEPEPMTTPFVAATAAEKQAMLDDDEEDSGEFEQPRTGCYSCANADKNGGGCQGPNKAGLCPPSFSQAPEFMDDLSDLFS